MQAKPNCNHLWDGKYERTFDACSHSFNSFWAWWGVPAFSYGPCLSGGYCRARGGGEAMNLNELRIKNIVRQELWCSNGVKPDLSFRGCELGGETGEALNVIKKLERERLGWPGSRSDVKALASELADVVICADLCAIAAGIDLSKAVKEVFNRKSAEIGLQVFLD